MRIARAPVRICFAGDGTDVEPFCSDEGGYVLSLGIKPYITAMYPSFHPHYSAIEKIIASHFKIKEGISILSSFPLRTGLGASASCFVAGIKAVSPQLTRDEIVKLAIDLEQNTMMIGGGKQDQYMATYGGFNFMTFSATKSLVETLSIPDMLQDLLLLVYVGERTAEDIIEDQRSRLQIGENLESFRRLKSIAVEMKDIVSKDLEGFGVLLHEAWEVKRRLSPLVTNNDIDNLYADCCLNGAIGGKLAGAGGGGYMVLMEHPAQRRRLHHYLQSKAIGYTKVEIDNDGVVLLE